MGERTLDQLKAEAKELGIWAQIRGSKPDELAQAIDAERARREQKDPESNNEPLNTPPVEGEKPPVVEPPVTSPIKVEKAPTPVAPAKKPEVKKKFNAVVILNGKMEVRTYSLEVHGEKFADLAAGFANDHGYEMKMIDTGDNITCPSCGHSFDPSK